MGLVPNIAGAALLSVAARSGKSEKEIEEPFQQYSKKINQEIEGEQIQIKHIKYLLELYTRLEEFNVAILNLNQEIKTVYNQGATLKDVNEREAKLKQSINSKLAIEKEIANEANKIFKYTREEQNLTQQEFVYLKEIIETIENINNKARDDNDEEE